MRKLILGFCGYAGAGKDTAADQIMYEDSWFAGRAAFAYPMREMLYALGVPRRNMVDRELKEAPIPWLGGHSYRKLAQTLGTEWGRNCLGENFWVDAAFARVKLLLEGHDVMLITDVRFPNEAARLKAEGGYLIRINRPGLAPVNPHPSEEHVPHFKPDFDVDNDSTVEALRDKLLQIVHDLRDEVQ